MEKYNGGSSPVPECMIMGRCLGGVMKDLLVSICIPEYKSYNYIDRNLKSILSQTYQNIEVILVDDASPDNTKEKMLYYMQNYPQKIHGYFSSKNGGIGVTKNKALEKATGDYIFFCDCDDVLKPNCIEVMVEQAKQENYPDIVIDGFTRVDQDGNMLYERRYDTINEAIQQSIPLFAKLYKRSFLQNNQILSPEKVILEDVLYQARVVPNHPSLAMVNNCGYIWFCNLDSASHTKLTGFAPEALDAGMKYLLKGKQLLKDSQARQEMTYYVMQYAAWHLLRSGTGIGAKNANKESVRVKQYLEEYFPEYKRLDYVSLRTPVGTRRVVRWAVLAVALIMKFSLEKPLFSLYGGLNLSKFWPDL